MKQPTDSDSLSSASSEKDTAHREWDNTLIVYSSVEGYVSFRDRRTGSWLISAMCKVTYTFSILAKKGEH